MAIVNALDNTANVIFDGVTKATNVVSTLLSLFPTCIKTVDKLTAKVGDTLTYTLTLENINLTPISSVKISDILPLGCEYVADSFSINGATKIAVYNSTTRELSYTIASVPSLVPQIITFQVEVVGAE